MTDNFKEIGSLFGRESRYEVANHFSTMNRARVELSAFIQS